LVFGCDFRRIKAIISFAGIYNGLDLARFATAMHVAFSFQGISIMRRSITPASLFVILTVAVNAQTHKGTAAETCGCDCLRGFITQYLGPMINHNPKAVAAAPTERFTEDTKTLPLGEGLWKGASKVRSCRGDLLSVAA